MTYESGQKVTLRGLANPIRGSEHAQRALRVALEFTNNSLHGHIPGACDQNHFPPWDAGL